MPSRDPLDLCPTLQVFWPKLRDWYEEKFPGRRLILTCTHRTKDEQRVLFSMNDSTGKIVTRCDGVKTLSKHNYYPSHAFDVAVIINERAKWDESLFTPIGKAIEELNYSDRISWGGNWSFRDYPHVQMRWPKDYGKTVYGNT